MKPNAPRSSAFQWKRPEISGNAPQCALPRIEEFLAAADRIGPYRRVGADVVASNGGTKLRAYPQLPARAGALQPDREEILGELDIVEEFGREPSVAVGDGNLAMLAAEGPAVEEARVLDQARVVQQPAGPILRLQVLHDRQMGMIPSHGQ